MEIKQRESEDQRNDEQKPEYEHPVLLDLEDVAGGDCCSTGGGSCDSALSRNDRWSNLRGEFPESVFRELCFPVCL